MTPPKRRKRKAREPKRYDYVKALAAAYFDSDDIESAERRVLRKLVRETVRRCASGLYMDEREYLQDEANNIAKELVP